MSEGAFTFASQGFLAAALALGRSFVAEHPGRTFHVVTVGEVRLPLELPPGIDFVRACDMPVPGGRRFLFRYPVRALCAALKPFAFQHLFDATGTERLLYLDADMLVLRPMVEAWNALDRAHAMLVPALPGLPMSGRAPGMREALLRGAFDTSIVGMRRGAETARLLDWWGRQVFVDCRDAPADGLYLDRRFMDLVPGAFPGAGILHHPGYNTDAWTLAETGGAHSGSTQGTEPACFHFRGYQPGRPGVFAGFRGTAHVAENPLLASLSHRYAQLLASPGMPTDERHLPQCLSLDNGIVVSRSLAAVELQAARRRLRCPSPDTDPDGFCAYATQSDARAYGTHVAPLVSALLGLRPDVAAAFPAASSDRGDRGFLHWLHTCGVDEEDLGPLLQRFGRNLATEHPVQAALAAHPGGPGLSAAAVYLPEGVEGAVARVMDGYFSDPALRAAAPLVYDDRGVATLVAAMTSRLIEFPAIDQADLLVFPRAIRRHRESLLLACLRYNPVVRRLIGGAPSLSRRDAIRSLLLGHGYSAAWPAVEAALFDPAYSPPEGLDQEPALGVNLCGLLRDASGMGELARAYGRSLDQARVPHARAVLPGRVPARLDEDVDPRHRYGGLDHAHQVNLVVANPHSRAFVDEWLDGMRSPAQANIAAWAWETERMPAHFARASTGLDAIFSISRFSADAIAASVDCPVHVVHPAPDFDALALATPDRDRFGLPHEVLLFGFFFDTYSILERKNPAGLLDAFRAAFDDRKDVGLVLKVNSPDAGDYDFAMLKQRARGLNVFWIEERLTQAWTYDLMASLDAYVSLHRAEGFGLTMAEAMAMAKPVIATGYSGNLDFMDGDSALLVDYEVVTTRRPHGAYPAGSRWAQPSVAHCADLMRALEDGALRQRIGTAGSRKLRSSLDPAATGRRIDALCRRILAAK